MTVLLLMFSDSESEISLNIGQYLTKLRRTKQDVSIVCQFWGGGTRTSS